MDVKTIERNIVREQDIHPQINYNGKKNFYYRGIWVLPL